MSRLTELRDLVSGLAVRGGESNWIDSMSCFRTTSPTKPLGSTARPTLALVLQGRKHSALLDRVYEYRAGQYLTVTLDLPLVSQIVEASPAEPFVAFGMPLQPALIAQLLLETGERAGTASGPALAVSDADDELLDAIARLLRLTRDPAAYRVVAPGVVREIHWRLMTGPQGALLRQIGAADSRITLVAQAARWLQAHFAEPLRAEELAAHVGLSVSSLNRHFRAATSMSPLQYQKTLRLQQARIELLANPGDVAGAGHRVGYGSLSQFSREYRRMFGASPSNDAIGLQAEAVSAIGVPF